MNSPLPRVAALLTSMLCLALCGSLPGAAGAAAVPGGLSALGCVAETGSNSDVCGGLGYGLSGPFAVAVSPDGKNVYAAGPNGGVAVLNRAADGALTFASCAVGSGNADAAHCTQATGLSVPIDAVVSPDGSSVYVLSDGELAVFTRHVDGSLSSDGCIQDSSDGSGCATTLTGNMLNVLGRPPGGLTVSPDGKDVYVAANDSGGANFNGALSVFSRASGGGLTFLGCFHQLGDATSGCTQTAPAITNPEAVVASADAVYVEAGSGVQAFSRTANGSLSAQACFQEPPASSPCVSMPGAGGYTDGGVGLAIGDGGDVLYSAGAGTADIGEYSIAADGSLTPIGCVAGPQGDTACGTDVPALCSPQGIAISPDGLDVYVSDHCGAVEHFTTNADGTLAEAGCVSEPNTTSVTCTQTSPGLDSPYALALSPDGTGVYVAGNGSNAVTAFARTPHPSAVTLTTSATGSGSVSGMGLTCTGATCTGSYPPGTSVTLTATPASGGGFTGWGGACSGTASPCTVRLLSDTNVSASFVALAKLTVTVNGPGDVSGGQTGASGAPVILCGSACSATYPVGTAITLTAATPPPDSGESFSGWGAPCMGVGVCTFTLTGDTTVTAAFIGGIGLRPQPPVVAHTLSALAISKGRLRLTTRHHRSTLTAATLTYTDTVADSATFTVVRVARGIKRGSRCVAAPAKRAAHGSALAHSCTRTLKTGIAHTVMGADGVNHVTLASILGSHRLKPGTYHVILTITGFSPVSVTVTVVR